MGDQHWPGVRWELLEVEVVGLFSSPSHQALPRRAIMKSPHNNSGSTTTSIIKFYKQTKMDFTIGFIFLFPFSSTEQFNINSLLWLKSCDDDHSEDLFIFNLIPMAYPDLWLDNTKML